MSGSAFNALLKTLEEPPAHVIFILATTEVHKLPATILSRCQRFDFKSVEDTEIIVRLVEVLAEVGREYDLKAVEMIADAADGGLRDALSILDKCCSVGDKITTELSADGKRATLTHSTGEKIYVTLLGDGSLEVMNCTESLLSGTAPAEGEYSRDNYSRLVVRYKGVKSINTALVIDTCEDAGVKENIGVEMWKTL